jgi:hypothetical protein
MHVAIASILLFMSFNIFGAQITIDFSDPNIPGEGLEEGFETQGYSFTFEPVPIPAPPAYVMSDALNFCPGCDLIMASANGAAFSLYSFEGWVFGDDVDIQVTGFLEAGGTVTETFQFEGVLDVFQHYDVNWSGLTSVKFDNLGPNPTILDNLVVSEVPIPAAAWLFGSALAGLGWMRRKQAV